MYPAVTHSAAKHQGPLFWITCKQLKQLRKAGSLQLIQNSAPFVAGRHQCCIWIPLKLTLNSEFEMWKLYDFAYHYTEAHYTTCVSSWGSLLFWIMITNAKAAHVEWLSIFIASIQLSATLQIFTGWMGFITGNFL
mgnify:CR=1 FL=1